MKYNEKIFREKIRIISTERNRSKIARYFAVHRTVGQHPSIYSDIQKTWDINKNEAHINLIVAGSNKTMLMKLFEGSHEPLFGRQTQSIRLQPFTPSILKEILDSYNPKYNNDDLLALYSVTGGVARYVELLMDAGAVTKKRIYDEIFREHSMFITEGRNHLIEEFGKDYGLYFSILTAIATGHYERSQIEEIVGAGVGGQLSSLEEIYGMIAKHQPLFATSKKNTKYMCRATAAHQARTMVEPQRRDRD